MVMRMAWCDLLMLPFSFPFMYAPTQQSVAPRIHVRNGIPGNTASKGIVGSAISPPAKTRMFPVVLSPFRRAAPPASRCKSANVTRKKLRIK